MPWTTGESHHVTNTSRAPTRGLYDGNPNVCFESYKMVISTTRNAQTFAAQTTGESRLMAPTSTKTAPIHTRAFIELTNCEV